MRRITTDYEKNRMTDTICKLAFAMAAITTHKWFLKSTGLVHGLKLIEKKFKRLLSLYLAFLTVSMWTKQCRHQTEVWLTVCRP